jgi:hypothetical protein
MGFGVILHAGEGVYCTMLVDIHNVRCSASLQSRTDMGRMLHHREISSGKVRSAGAVRLMRLGLARYGRK